MMRRQQHMMTDFSMKMMAKDNRKALHCVRRHMTKKTQPTRNPATVHRKIYTDIAFCVYYTFKVSKYENGYQACVYVLTLCELYLKLSTEIAVHRKHCYVHKHIHAYTHVARLRTHQIQQAIARKYSQRNNKFM